MLIYKPKHKTAFKTIHWLKICHLYWHDWLKIQSNKSMSPNNNYAYHV